MNAAQLLTSLLNELVRRGGSDLFLQTGMPPRIRVDRRVRALEQFPPVTPSLMQALITEIMPEAVQAEFRRELDADFSFEEPGIGRFRVNAYHQKGTPALAMRRIPESVQTLQDLGLPQEKLLEHLRSSGLFLVTGPTGSGKSTTLASIIEHFNVTREVNIITIEDPIEFIFTPRRALISQRELGTDAKSWSRALRAALRQNPDIIMVGELRDPETISLALSAAETGHLVLGTLHTRNAPETIERIVDSFQGDRQAQVRAQLAASLVGILSQRLLPRRGGGMALAYELLFNTDAIASAIREGKTHQIRSYMQAGQREGMVEMDRVLEELVRRGIVSPEDARNVAIRPEQFRAGIPRFR